MSPALHRVPLHRALGVLALLVAVTIGAKAGADEREPAEDLAEARRHLERLTALGPRPSGSDAGRDAARYLAETLTGSGWEVSLQEGTGTSRVAATAGRVRNVVGWLPAAPAGPGSGGEHGAVLLAAHYDSVVDGPGAMDNAASVAAILVTARRLAESGRRARPAVVLFTDGEERYLLGADLFVRESPLADRVGAFVNLDHSGRGGPLFAFELAPPNGGMLDVLKTVAAGTAGLRAYSFAADVYRLLPFDTDFTVLRSLGVPGVNLAFAGDGYRYHTRLDGPAEVPDASLARLVGAVQSLARHLVVTGAPLGAGDDAASYATFFSIGGFTVALSRAVLSGLTLVLTVVAVIQVVGGLRRDRRGVLRCWLAMVLASPAAIVLLAGLVAALRLAAGCDQVAYANPWPFFALLAVTATGGLLLAGKVTGARETGTSARLSAVIGMWALLAATAVLLAPGSAAFFLVPLAGLVGAAGLLRRAGTGGGGTAAAFLLALGAVVVAWAGPLAALLPLLMTTVPKVGPEPLLFWPIALGILTTLVSTAPWAFLSRRQAGLAAWGPAGAAAAALASVLVLPAYDTARPQRAWRYHVSGGAKPYQVLASADRLPEAADARRGPGPELADLFWLDPGWWRAVESSSLATPLPQVQIARDGEKLVVDVEPPPGSDVVLLRLQRTGIEATTPPASPQGRGPMVLRWVVSGGERARFEVRGAIPAGSQARVFSIGPGLPQDSAVAPTTIPPARVVGERTMAFVDVTIPDAVAPAVSPLAGAQTGRTAETDQTGRRPGAAPDDAGR